MLFRGSGPESPCCLIRRLLPEYHQGCLGHRLEDPDSFLRVDQETLAYVRRSGVLQWWMVLRTVHAKRCQRLREALSEYGIPCHELSRAGADGQQTDLVAIHQRPDQLVWRNFLEEWQEQQTQLVCRLSSCSQDRLPRDWVPEQAPRKELPALGSEKGEK